MIWQSFLKIYVMATAIIPSSYDNRMCGYFDAGNRIDKSVILFTGLINLRRAYNTRHCSICIDILDLLSANMMKFALLCSLNDTFPSRWICWNLLLHTARFADLNHLIITCMSILNLVCLTRWSDTWCTDQGTTCTYQLSHKKYTGKRFEIVHQSVMSVLACIELKG